VNLFELLWTTYETFGVGPRLWVVSTAVSFVLAGCIGLSLNVLSRRKPSGSAVAWIGLIWMSPLVGWTAYALLGVNRVQRKAQRLFRDLPDTPDLRQADDADVPEGLDHLAGLARAGDQVTGHRLVHGNRVVPLRNGDQAYPAMLDAIDGAEHSVAFLTYILDDDPWGRRFEVALRSAHERGVEVRVLVDGIGAMRGRSLFRRLQRAGVPCGSFLWSWIPWQMALINLRNHRKLLVADGRTAFTGGINIREAYVHAGGPGTARDLHFEVAGPVVRELMAQFVVDWAFDVGEVLEGPAWFPELAYAGSCAARVIPHGPDEDADKIAKIMFQAVAAATEEVVVVTPYFLPSEALRMALAAAAERGVRVEVILPENNVPQLMNDVALEDSGDLVHRGVHLGFAPGPFAHTKLMVVDRSWTLLGSSNWDPRSLRLNFELNMEAYSRAVAQASLEQLAELRESTQWLGPDDVVLPTVGRRLRARVLRLFKPYL